MNKRRGYTLIELIVAVGLFALVMVLVSGVYLVMISLNRQVQGMVTGINNLSFALETMTRDIRSSTDYSCGGVSDCTVSTFTFENETGTQVSYSLSAGTLVKTAGFSSSTLTDPSVNITSLLFYIFGARVAPGDYQQARVTIIVSGTVSTGPGKTEPFTVETGATMRGSDI